MTQRSQLRTPTGKRGAAQRKARREGYAQAGLNQHWWAQYSDAKREATFTVFPAIDYPHSPHLRAAFRHGAHDWARKHEGQERVVF